MSSVNPFPDDLVEDPDAALLVVSPGLLVLFATAAAERLLGASPGSLLGMGMDTLVPLERRRELNNFEAVLAGGGGRRLRTALRAADGRRVDVSLTLSPRTDQLGCITSVSARYEPARSSADWVRASLAPPRPSVTAALQPPLAKPLARHSMSYPQGSEPRPAPSGPAIRLRGQLAELEGRLRWLEERLSRPPGLSPLDDPSERGRALSVVGEARDLTARCQRALQTDSDRDTPVPAPPKLPSR